MKEKFQEEVLEEVLKIIKMQRDLLNKFQVSMTSIWATELPLMTQRNLFLKKIIMTILALISPSKDKVKNSFQEAQKISMTHHQVTPKYLAGDYKRSFLLIWTQSWSWILKTMFLPINNK